MHLRESGLKNMKINHLPFVTAVLVTICLLTTSATAQNSDSEISINVSAELITSIEMITVQSMKLSEAEAVNSIIRINPQNSAFAGKIIAIGQPNAEIRVSFLEKRELTHNQSSSNLLFNYEVAGNSQDNQSSAEILERENRELKLNSEGEFFLWIGGSVDISTASPGNYQGDFTLEVDYI